MFWLQMCKHALHNTATVRHPALQIYGEGEKKFLRAMEQHSGTNVAPFETALYPQGSG